MTAYEPLDLPTAGFILALAPDHETFKRWQHEACPTIRGQRKAVYAGSAQSVVGLRPTVIVKLPRWHEHRNAQIIEQAALYCALKAGGTEILYAEERADQAL